MKKIHSISIKLTIVTTLITIFAIVITGWLVFNQSNELMLKANSHTMKANLKYLHEKFSTAVNEAQHQAVFLTKSTFIKQIFSDNELRKTEGKLHLSHEFSGILKSGNYLQVRLIDANNGMELVRLDKPTSQDKRPQVVKNNNLQNKKRRTYVILGRTLKPGQVYISNLNLNREHGKIEQPIRPTLRIVAPVFLNDKNLSALIVINFDASDLINSLDTPEFFNLIVTNDQGEILYHPDKSREWQHELGNSSVGINQEKPLLWQAVLNEKSPIFHDIANDHYYLLSKIPISKTADNRFIAMILQAKESIILNEINLFRDNILGLAFIIIITAIIVIFTLSRFITYPIRRLTEETNTLALSEDDINISVTGNDEITHLSLSFKTLLSKLKNQQEQVEMQSRELRELNESLERQVKQRTSELEVSEQRSRLLLDSAGEGIFGIDSAGICTFINPAAARMLGFDAEELIGCQMHEIVHHSYADGSAYPIENCPMSATYRENITQTVRNEVLWHKDGHSFPIIYSSTPILKNKKTIGAVVTFSDISKQKHVEEELRLLANTFKTKEAILITDNQGKIIRVNNALCHLTGYQENELIGHKPIIFKSGQQQKKFYQQLWKILSTDGYWEGELINQRKNKESFPVWLSISAVYDENKVITHFIGSYRDFQCPDQRGKSHP